MNQMPLDVGEISYIMSVFLPVNVNISCEMSLQVEYNLISWENIDDVEVIRRINKISPLIPEHFKRTDRKRISSPYGYGVSDVVREIHMTNPHYSIRNIALVWMIYMMPGRKINHLLDILWENLSPQEKKISICDMPFNKKFRKYFEEMGIILHDEEMDEFLLDKFISRKAYLMRKMKVKIYPFNTNGDIPLLEETFCYSSSTEMDDDGVPIPDLLTQYLDHLAHMILDE